MRRATDLALIVLVAVAPSLGTIRHLGFYSDDWTMVGQFLLAPDQSLSGLLEDSYSHHYRSRPVQALYSALLYQVFGTDPFGYHVMSVVLIALAALLAARVLMALGVSRTAAVASAAVFAALPNFSSARLWFAVAASPLSLVLFLLAVLADLRAWRTHGTSVIGWRLAALALLTISLMAYELVLPLAFALALLGLMAPPGHGVPRQTWPRAVLFVVPTIALLVAVAQYKAWASGRLGGVSAAGLERIWSHAFDLGTPEGTYGLVLTRALGVNFGQHVAALPGQLWHLRDRADIGAVLTALAVAGLTATVLVRASRESMPRPGAWLALGAAGVALFLGGYAVFLTNNAIQITATGVGNRTALVAGIGVAMIVVAGFGALTAHLPRPEWRPTVFAGCTAALIGCGVLANHQIATYWVDAVDAQRQVLTAIDRHLPELPEDTTLLVGGTCRYAGPAVVFESSWDLAFALRMRRGDASLAADLIGPGVSVRPDALVTTLYDEEYPYAYGPRTLLFEARTGETEPLFDADAATRALARMRLPRTDCPWGLEGVGVPIYR